MTLQYRFNYKLNTAQGQEFAELKQILHQLDVYTHTAESTQMQSTLIMLGSLDTPTNN